MALNYIPGYSLFGNNQINTNQTPNSGPNWFLIIFSAIIIIAFFKLIF